MTKEPVLENDGRQYGVLVYYTDRPVLSLRAKLGHDIIILIVNIIIFHFYYFTIFYLNYYFIILSSVCNFLFLQACEEVGRHNDCFFGKSHNI